MRCVAQPRSLGCWGDFNYGTNKAAIVQSFVSLRLLFYPVPPVPARRGSRRGALGSFVVIPPLLSPALFFTNEKSTR